MNLPGAGFVVAMKTRNKKEIHDPRELRKDYNKLIWKLFAEGAKKTPTGWTLLLGAGNAAPEDAKLFQALDANHFLTLTIGCSWVPFVH
jgi:hypothetical protein